jgi:cysteine-rich repeat protein
VSCDDGDACTSDSCDISEGCRNEPSGDSDGDGICQSLDNCPNIHNPKQEDADGDSLGDTCDNCPQQSNEPIPAELLSVLAGLNTNHAEITALVPDRFDFSGGATGSSIDDGGNDMYDGGNILNTDLGGSIQYTNGMAQGSDSIFGTGSRYFTAKHPGLFVLAASDVSINSFAISGNNGADDSGNVDSATLRTTMHGFEYTAFIKRVWDAGDPSINHIIVTPGNGSGITQSISSNTDSDAHGVDGLSGVGELYFLLVARSEGRYLADDDALAIVNKFLERVVILQADGDADGAGDACDNCPNDYNPVQTDCNGNGIGDACDGEPCSICGDGLVRGAEQCDDGNLEDGDGCSGTCGLEQGWTCPNPGQLCEPICGDDLVRGSEECDDGNLVDGDGCSATCTSDPPQCLLDVDGSGAPARVSTDVVYIARRLFGFAPVPPSFRVADPTIPPDATIAANVDAAVAAFDVDLRNGTQVATDIVYIARRLFGFAAVPPSFRQADPTIPPDAEIGARIDALCP